MTADLTTADLTTADLTTADLTTADLTTADLTTADLTTADLTTADLTTADLSASLPDEHASLLADMVALRDRTAILMHRLYSLYPSLPVISRLRLALELMPEQVSVMREATWQDASLSREDEAAISRMYDAYEMEMRRVISLTSEPELKPVSQHDIASMPIPADPDQHMVMGHTPRTLGEGLVGTRRRPAEPTPPK